MTLSLVARSPEGAFGVVISSSSPAVASRCAHLMPGVGASADLAVTDGAILLAQTVIDDALHHRNARQH